MGNFRVEPPGLFRGRGEHPKMGMIKRRIYPRDITINIGVLQHAPCVLPKCGYLLTKCTHAGPVHSYHPEKGKQRQRFSAEIYISHSAVQFLEPEIRCHWGGRRGRGAAGAPVCGAGLARGPPRQDRDLAGLLEGCARPPSSLLAGTL